VTQFKEETTMATVREHLQKAHAAIAAHHRVMAKCHSQAMEKIEDGEPQHSFHKTAAAAHEAAATAHEQMCEECAKAADAVDLTKRGDELRPDPVGLSRLAPPPGVTAIPRTGSPALSAGPAVPSEFQKLFSVEDEEEATLLRR
jgi:hypothetical protein